MKRSQINTYLKIIAANIRNKRESRNYTQDHISYLSGITQKEYVKIESGRTKIPLKQLIKISEILGCELEDLFIFKLEVVYKRKAS